MPRCKLCDKEINKETESWVKMSAGYYHTKCRDIRNYNKLVKCAYCGEQVKKGECTVLNGRNYHKDCAKEYTERRELYDFCCKLWGLKAPGPTIATQAKKFREEGYTFKGMRQTLDYVYNVKRLDRWTFKGEEQIGIVRVYYDEAREYYTDLMNNSSEIEDDLAKRLQQSKIVKVKMTKAEKSLELYEF